MTKTRQRKESLFYQGKADGKAGRHFAWRRHPQIQAYRRGYKEGRELYLRRFLSPSAFVEAVSGQSLTPFEKQLLDTQQVVVSPLATSPGRLSPRLPRRPWQGKQPHT